MKIAAIALALYFSCSMLFFFIPRVKENPRAYWIWFKEASLFLGKYIATMVAAWCIVAAICSL